MNSEQCRVARAMMGWTIKQLSHRVRVAQRTISDFEVDGRVRPEIAARIRSIFTTNGIEFIQDDDGFGLKRRFNLDEYIARAAEQTSRSRFLGLEASSIEPSVERQMPLHAPFG